MFHIPPFLRDAIARRDITLRAAQELHSSGARPMWHGLQNTEPNSRTKKIQYITPEIDCSINVAACLRAAFITHEHSMQKIKSKHFFAILSVILIGRLSKNIHLF
jgi:hypothetical protein